MAIIKPATPFDSVKRKFSGTDEIHFKNRTADNATIGVRMKHPYDGGNSDKQIAVRDAFTAAQTAAKAILNAKSTDTDQANYTKFTEYTKAFKAQKGKRNGYLYLRDYIVAQEFVKPEGE
ncbi:MAG: hypothetical protein MJZ84_08940 [Paludibacteraceae bacterium]|nr:hypothetical protein [Paludibacteraceae bacterium]